MIPRPAGGGVMKVSSPKFIEPDSTPEMSGFASRPVVRSSIVMSLAPPVETIVSRSRAGADPLDHVLEQLGAPAGRAVVLAHVQVHDGGAGAAGLDARVGDLLGRVGDVRVVLAEDVGPGDGAP